MKIRKNDFKAQMKNCKDPDEYIGNVINPFEPQISKQGIKVTLARKRNYNFEIKANWVAYQLVLFNIVQNAVKYNKF
jgi:hypothetical protein